MHVTRDNFVICGRASGTSNIPVQYVNNLVNISGMFHRTYGHKPLTVVCTAFTEKPTNDKIISGDMHRVKAVHTTVNGLCP
jgi:hypothetical protein